MCKKNNPEHIYRHSCLDLCHRKITRNHHSSMPTRGQNTTRDPHTSLHPVYISFSHFKKNKYYFKKKKNKKKLFNVTCWMIVLRDKTEIIPCNIWVSNQGNSNYMMGHHHREILPSSLPCKERSNAVGVESTLAHIVKL